jgi:hypothetical protein
VPLSLAANCRAGIRQRSKFGGSALPVHGLAKQPQVHSGIRFESRSIEPEFRELLKEAEAAFPPPRRNPHRDRIAKPLRDPTPSCHSLTKELVSRHKR